MSTRDKLLAVFDGKPGQMFSGEALARRLGVSRMAVWKQVQTLKQVGLPIESTDRQGYRLQVPFDSSLVRLTSSGWLHPHYFLNTPSTQVLAKAGAAAGLPEGHVWIAETQSKGRGRLDREWESRYGGLWFSVLLRPPIVPSRVPPLALVAGLALRDAVAQVCAVQAKLKWPNDVVVASRGSYKKIAGILTEMSGQMDRTEWVVIGVGLNVNNVLPKDLSARAVSLYSLTGKVGDRAKLLKAFMENLEEGFSRYKKQGFEGFRRTYWSHYFAPDKPVVLRTAEGILRGKARGVDGFGAIMIESDTNRSDAGRVASRRKIRSISEGEISL